MKKVLALIIAAMFIVGVVPAFADGEITVYFNYELVEFDVPPQIINSRTMVPMRAVFEMMDAEVTWDQSTRTATANRYGSILNITIDSDVMFLDGTPIKLDSPAVLIDGRTLVPVRAISEAWDCEVEWDGETRSVYITSADFYEGDYFELPEQEEVRVSTVEEFFDAIGDNRHIILSKGVYNLSTADAAKTREQVLTWGSEYSSEPQWIIANVFNTTIDCTEGAEFVIENVDNDVLRFEGCYYLTLDGVKAGHIKPNEEYMCEGDVVTLIDCYDVGFYGCDLYGCGAVGIYANASYEVYVIESRIHHCTYTGIWAIDSDIYLGRCVFEDCNAFSGVANVSNSYVALDECDIKNFKSDEELFWVWSFDDNESSYVGVYDCNFTNNVFGELVSIGANDSIQFINVDFEGKGNDGNITQRDGVEYLTIDWDAVAADEEGQG